MNEPTPVPDSGRNSPATTLSCLAAPFLLVFLLFAGTTFNNDRKLDTFAENFAAMAHPAGSKSLLKTQSFGTFGKDHHYDFVVGEVRSFAGDPQTLRQFYANTRIAVPVVADDGSQDIEGGKQKVDVTLLPSPLPANFHWKRGAVGDLDLSGMAGQKGLYALQIMNMSPVYNWASTFDWRCH